MISKEPYLLERLGFGLEEFALQLIWNARPADLPVEQATEVALKVNIKTGKASASGCRPALPIR
jgi:hypothetical protein